MAGQTIRRSAKFSSIINDNEDSIFTDIDTNPGSTRAEIATSTGIASSLVKIVLAYFLNGSVIVERFNTAGGSHYWTAGDWATTIRDNIQAARDWIRDPAPATGSITTVNKASLNDGETFVLNDGVNAAVTFEFDKAGDGVTGGNVAIDISGVSSKIDVRDEIVTAINGAANLDIQADPAIGGGTINLTNLADGTAGNTTITETVSDVGFTVSGMSGGLDDNNGDDEDALAVAVFGATPTNAEKAVAVALAALLQNETIGVTGSE